MSGRGCPKNRVSFRTASVVEVLEDIVSFPEWCESTHLVVCFTMDQRRSYSSSHLRSHESAAGTRRPRKRESTVIQVSCSPSMTALLSCLEPRCPEPLPRRRQRSEEHTSELQSRFDLV